MELSQWLNIVQVIVIIATLCVLIKYTYETKKLREAAVNQNEISLRPCITIYQNRNALFLKNIGHSPALNIFINELEFDESALLFDSVEFLEPSSSTKIWFTVARKKDLSTMMKKECNLNKIIIEVIKGRERNKNEINIDEFVLCIQYKNMQNKYYYSKVSMSLLGKIDFLGTG